MGLFDSLEQAAGLGGQGGEGGGGANPAALGAVAQMLQSQPGGIGGILQKFEGAGLGGAAQSWLGGGQNQTVSPDQVQGALGPDAVSQVAGQLGVPPDQAAGHIAQFLPMIMDHLSPGGQAPAGGGGGELQSLISRFAGQAG